MCKIGGKINKHGEDGEGDLATQQQHLSGSEVKTQHETKSEFGMGASKKRTLPQLKVCEKKIYIW